MIPKSGSRFSDKIMLQQRLMIAKSGHRFPAFAKRASAGEARSDRIMLQQRDMIPVKLRSGVLRGYQPALARISCSMEGSAGPAGCGAGRRTVAASRFPGAVIRPRAQPRGASIDVF